MTNILNEILETYLADKEWQQYKQKRTETRNAALPKVTTIVHSFVSGATTLQTLCDQLNETFKNTGERWGAQGHSFMFPMYKIIKHHDEKAPVAETQLRKNVTDLNAENTGQRIEAFYDFLLAERTRLRQEGKPSGVAAEAGKSALIISLFAFWLHPEQQSIVYHEGVRNGLALLTKKQLISPPKGLRMNRDVVIITTHADHQAFQQAISDLLAVNQDIKSGLNWAEFFFYWLVHYFQTHTQPTLIKEPDTNILSPGPGAVHERHASYDRVSLVTQTTESFENNPLTPTPEPLLTRLIHEVQRHILVDEAVIRRIYHALLAGHVILAGPPGTGKTELARLIPEILWKRAENNTETDESEEVALTSRTTYTTRMVTATDEWSVRTLISGITPVSQNGSVSYQVQYGHLTSTILKNWSSQGENPEEWSTLTLRRSPVTSSSGVERGTPQTFRGQWLVIDEFNRAPIDLALGGALTALGGNDTLRVSVEGGSAELPIPRDFRVIGTLNSFDRNYLNQISEALKRRFSFVEILPPTRTLREAEQAMVFYKALKLISHLSDMIKDENDTLSWGESIGIEAEPTMGQYTITWLDEQPTFREAFEAAWRIFEVIRIYRQLGTAQAISLVRHMLLAGILQGYTTREDWISQALDAALCATIADQLQVLLPDEIDALLLYLTTEHTSFSVAYNQLLSGLVDRQQRLYGQLLSLSNISDERGEAYLSDEEIETIARSNIPEVAQEKLTEIFHLASPSYRLPQFTRRLRAFKAERGL